MKTRRLKKLIVAFVGMMLAMQAFPQSGNGSGGGDWKTNEVCLKNLSLYYEFYKHKNYNDAIKPWRIVYNECPESKESLFAYGVNMYKTFLDNEKDPAKKSAYADTINMIYAKRIQYFPKSKGDVLGRQGVDLLRYKRQDGIEFIKEGYDLLKESIAIEKAESSPVVITTFISAGITLFLNDQLDNESVINDYVIAAGILDNQMAKKPSSKTTQAKTAIDENIKESNVLTCDAINKIFSPKFEANKNDLDFLQLVTGFMIQAECELEPFYAQAAEQLYQLEPSYEAAYNLGRLFFKKEEYTKAKNYYLEAIERCDNNDLKANYYYELGVISQQYLNSPQDAVYYGMEATKLNPNWGEPYILIGSSYAAGNSSLGDDFEKRTAYWLAVDMFLKAKVMDPKIAKKAAELASEYSVYFPTKEDLFFRSITEGDSYTVGGWINRSTTARAKN
jgi:tetratricopeptide (TPR) repeat protein